MEEELDYLRKENEELLRDNERMKLDHELKAQAAPALPVGWLFYFGRFISV